MHLYFQSACDYVWGCTPYILTGRSAVLDCIAYLTMVVYAVSTFTRSLCWSKGEEHHYCFNIYIFISVKTFLPSMQS